MNEENGKELAGKIALFAIISFVVSLLFFLAGKTDKAIYLVLVSIALMQTVNTK